jgi:hypothetical protein
MRTSTRAAALPPDLESRLADYERQATAFVALHRSGSADVESFAPATAPVPPDLAAPGFVSFTGGPLPAATLRLP